MKVLVFQQDSQLISYLREYFDERIEEVVPVPVALDVIGSMVDLDQLIEQHEPSFFVMGAGLAVDADKLAQTRFRANVETIERVARKHGTPLIFLSSAMVFNGKRLGYKETDSPSPEHPVAKVYAELEKIISKKSRRHIILRTGWVFSGLPHNFLTDVVNHAITHELISVNSAAKACPTPMPDLARVLGAMILQLQFTQNAWGTYHYVSSDPVIGFQFVEAIVASASQFDERIVPSQLLFEHNDERTEPFYFEPAVMKCEKIRSVFGIHQKTWRQAVSSQVTEYFAWLEHQTVEQP